MNLENLVGKLINGSLSNLGIFDSEGNLEASRLPKVVNHINEGLLRLHSRFMLREDDVLVDMIDGITEYHLIAKYALSYQVPEGELDVPHRYIMDNAERPFEENVIQITRVINSLGYDHEINNKLAFASVFTPRPQVLQVPTPIPGQALAVQYQASHPVLTEDKPDQVIEIPKVLNGALEAYVAFLAFNDIGGPENMARAQGYNQIYENICLEMENKNSIGTETRTHTTVFEMRGFV